MPRQSSRVPPCPCRVSTLGRAGPPLPSRSTGRRVPAVASRRVASRRANLAERERVRECAIVVVTRDLCVPRVTIALPTGREGTAASVTYPLAHNTRGIAAGSGGRGDGGRRSCHIYIQPRNVLLPTNAVHGRVLRCEYVYDYFPVRCDREKGSRLADYSYKQTGSYKPECMHL